MRSVVKNLLNYRNFSVLRILSLPTSNNNFQQLRKNIFQFSSEHTKHEQIIMPAEVQQNPSIQEICLKLAYLAQKEPTPEINNWIIKLLEDLNPFIDQLNIIQLKLFLHQFAKTLGPLELEEEEALYISSIIDTLNAKKEADLFECLETYNILFGLVEEPSMLFVNTYNFIESALENPELNASSLSQAVLLYSQITREGELQYSLEQNIINAIKRIDPDYQIVLEGKQSNLKNFEPADIGRVAWGIIYGSLNNKELYTYLKNKSLQIEISFTFLVKVIATSALFQDQDQNLFNKLKQSYDQEQEPESTLDLMLLVNSLKTFEVNHVELRKFAETIFFDLHVELQDEEKMYLYSRFSMLKYDSIKIWKLFDQDFDAICKSQRPSNLDWFLYNLLDSLHLMEVQTAEKVLAVITDLFEQMESHVQAAISEKLLEIGLVEQSELESLEQQQENEDSVPK